MRVGAEDGKSLVPVDLAGVGWRRLRCDAIGPVQSQALGRGGGFLSGLSGGLQMCRIDGEWLEAFDEAMLSFFAIDHADAGISACWSATRTCRPERLRWRLGRTMSCVGWILFGRHRIWCSAAEYYPAYLSPAPNE